MKKFIKTGALTAAILLTGTISAIAAALPASPRAGRSVWETAAGNSALVEADNNAFGGAEWAAVLKPGSKGGEVKEVQRRLKQWRYYKGEPDGIFGAGTKAAVIAFQKKNGLTADGIVGAATFRALGMNDSYNVLMNQTQNSKPSEFTSSDLYLLAKTNLCRGERGAVYGTGSHRSGHTQPRQKSGISQHDFRSRLSKACFHGGIGRSDQLNAQ